MTQSPGDLEATLQGFVARGELVGVVALAWRPEQPTREVAIGRMDVDRDLPVTLDTIFRIASLTKPVTSVVALTMVDEGRFELDEPITRLAPEFHHLRVLQDPEGSLDHTVPAGRAITFRDLLTHRSGLTYGDFHHGPIGAAYAATLGPTIDNVLSPDEWIARLATLPLVDQPGAAFHYGVSMDLLGFLLARIEGTTLGAVMRQRVFDPLGMRDTGFVVPPDKQDRRAALTGFDDEGRLMTGRWTIGPGRQTRTSSSLDAPPERDRLAPRPLATAPSDHRNGRRRRSCCRSPRQRSRSACADRQGAARCQV